MKSCLEYVPESGKFYWRDGRNGTTTKSEAGSLENYRPGVVRCRIRLDGRKYMRAHLAWLYMTGEPLSAGLQIDHKDGNPTNDAWDNLRKCTNAQNACNQKVRVHNTIGVKGVHEISGGFRAEVRRLGRRYARTFKSMEEAAEWVAHVRTELHGEFARHE